MAVEIIEFATPRFDELIKLRDKILRKPLNMEFYAKDIAEEYDSYHLAYYDGPTLKGCLVLKPLSDASIKMRQVAVDEAFQGQGIGKALVAASERFCKMQGFQKIELNARKTAVPFYLTQDYEKVGKEFVEVSVPHFKMQKVL